MLTMGGDKVEVRLLGHERRPESLDLANDHVFESVHDGYLGGVG